jgi:ferritin-like metal-binding protein YciE
MCRDRVAFQQDVRDGRRRGRTSVTPGLRYVSEGSADARREPWGMTDQTRSDVQEKHETTIADDVGDMVALESHIEEALDRQLTEVADDAEARAAVQRFHDLVKQHRDTLTALQEQVGTTAGNPIIAAGSTLLGKAAGVIDLVRTEGIAKALRDDYTAFSLAAISYSMLSTTALGLGNPQVAQLAERHLTDYAGAIERINEIMPGVVHRELVKDGHQMNSAAVGQTRSMVAKAWQVAES